MTQLETIDRWHAAVNAGDADAAGALCTDGVEVGGPRGSGFGRELVVEWVGHAGIRLDPVRWFCGSGCAVVEQDARWAADDGPTRLATAFRLHDGRISAVLRHPDTADALARLGLGAADEVTTRR